MSVIRERVRNNFINGLDKVLEQYETDYTKAKDELPIVGKTVGVALREQGSLPAFYGERKAELGALVKLAESRENAVRGSLYVKYTEVNSRELKDREKERYIDREESYILMHELYLEIKEVYDKYCELCDAWKLRGFALRDIVAAKTNAFEDYEIR